MAITDLNSLVAYLTAHLELDATAAAQLPTMIQLAEAKFNRLLPIPAGEARETASTVAGQQSILLPDTVLQIRSVLVDDDYALSPVHLNVLLSDFNNDSASGKPQVYTVADGSLFFGPIPDAVYTITITCQTKLTGLSTVNSSNWLLASHPDLYLYGTIFEVETWRRDLQAATAANAITMQLIDQITRQGNRYRSNQNIRLRSSVVV